MLHRARRTSRTGNGSDWSDLDLRILVLGPFRAVLGGHERPARTRQVSRVGAILAASPGVRVARDVIIETLWGTRPPSTAVNTLQVHISQLRAMVGRELVACVGDSYLLVVEPAQVDAEWFKAEVLACLNEAARDEPDALFDRLSDALKAWSGPPYANVDSPDIVARRAELVELRERALEAQLTLALRRAASPGDLSDVIAVAKGQITRQPLREAGYQVLTSALIADGRPVEAAAVYRRAVDLFRTSLGVEPSENLSKVVKSLL